LLLTEGVRRRALQQALFFEKQGIPETWVGLHARPHCLELVEGIDQRQPLAAHKAHQDSSYLLSTDACHAMNIDCASAETASADESVYLIKMARHVKRQRILCSHFDGAVMFADEGGGGEAEEEEFFNHYKNDLERHAHTPSGVAGADLGGVF